MRVKRKNKSIKNTTDISMLVESITKEDIFEYDENKIIENFRLILQWYKANDFKCEIEIFSGQWLDKPFCQGIFDVIYEEFKACSYRNSCSRCENMLP